MFLVQFFGFIVGCFLVDEPQWREKFGTDGAKAPEIDCKGVVICRPEDSFRRTVRATKD